MAKMTSEVDKINFFLFVQTENKDQWTLINPIFIFRNPLGNIEYPILFFYYFYIKLLVKTYTDSTNTVLILIYHLCLS